MNKKLKVLTSALLLCGSLLSAVPAHAEVTDLQENTAVESVEAVEAENEVETDTEEAVSIQPRYGESALVTGDAVALRKSPNLSCSVLERLNKGDVVYFLDFNSYYGDGYRWAHVSYFSPNGYYINGYIASKYLNG